MAFLFPNVIHNTRMLAENVINKYLLGNICTYLHVFYQYLKATLLKSHFVISK